MGARQEKHYIGIDIGGTKSTVILANGAGDILGREQFPTFIEAGRWHPTVTRLESIVAAFLRQKRVEAVGISCGGPLDRKRGVILSPPNLPGWDEVPVVEIFRNEFQLPTYLENDANAGALAEWRFGAGKGYRNIIFLTFGTGLGAGLILDGKLYTGASDLGGEVGHVRLADDGPVGYHKRGSFEGFCSGTGLAQMMACELAKLIRQVGHDEVVTRYKAPDEVTGKDVVEWAKRGDDIALQVVEKSGQYLGKGLSILIDILNPEVIVIGSMGVRLGELLLEPARKIVEKEALASAAAICKIMPAALGEKIGDYAAWCVAQKGEEQ